MKKKVHTRRGVDTAEIMIKNTEYQETWKRMSQTNYRYANSSSVPSSESDILSIYRYL